MGEHVLHHVENQPELLIFECPGCECCHGVNVLPIPGKPCWGWNGDMDKPTFSPSIRVGGTVPITDEQAQRILSGEKIEPVPLICHSFVKDGNIEFLGDCTHKLAGKTVQLERW